MGMMGPVVLLVVALADGVAASTPPDAKACIHCHESQRVASGSLAAWRASSHAGAGVTCVDCHFAEKEETGLSLCPQPSVRREVPALRCGGCHGAELETFRAGPHARAGQSLERAAAAAPGLPGTLRELQQCRACHVIGESDGRCDWCHTRHTFAATEARRPEACRSCHHGANHPEWELYTLSRHGSLYAVEGGSWRWDLPLADLVSMTAGRPANLPRGPVCVSCHAAAAGHAQTVQEVPPATTAVGGKGADLAERLVGTARPASRATPAARHALSTAAIAAAPHCESCHSATLVKRQAGGASSLIRLADALTAEALAEVAALYDAGRIPRPLAVPWSADLVDVIDPPSEIEESLWRIVLRLHPRVLSAVHHLDPEAASASGLGDLRAELRRLERLVAAVPAAPPAAR